MIVELVIVNVLLIAAVLMLLIKLRFWWIWLIDIAICIFVFVGSVLTIKKSKRQLTYTLYENVLHINTYSLEQDVDLTKVIAVRAKRSLFDKILKQGSHTIELYMNTKYNKKIVIYFMNEDIEQVVKDIIKHCEIAKNIKSLAFDKKI